MPLKKNEPYAIDQKRRIEAALYTYLSKLLAFFEFKTLFQTLGFIFLLIITIYEVFNGFFLIFFVVYLDSKSWEH